jgi:hypothetical protein
VTTERITLVLDEGGADGNLIVRGSAVIVPSLRFPDPADQMIIGQAPVRAVFGASGSPQVKLYPNDLIGPQQEDGNPGWAYTVTYDSSVPGAPAPWSFWLLSTGGSPQYLSDLASVPPAQPGQQYVPLPQNTPAVGDVPAIASLSPLVVAWGQGADKNYVQEFSVATTVSVAHNLGKYPAVTVFDSAGDQVEGNVDYADANNLTLTFSAAFSGTVTCN